MTYEDTRIADEVGGSWKLVTKAEPALVVVYWVIRSQFG